MKKSLPCLSALTGLYVACASIAVPAAVAATQASLPAGPATASESNPPRRLQPTAFCGDRLLVQAVKSARAAQQRDGTDCGTRRRSAASSCTASEATGSRVAATTLRVRMELQIAGQRCEPAASVEPPVPVGRPRLPTGRTVTRVNLRQLRADPVLAGGSIRRNSAGRGKLVAAQPDLTSQCGGLSSLLVALRRQFTFLPPQAMRLVLRRDSAGRRRPSRVRGRRALAEREVGGAGGRSRVESRESRAGRNCIDA